MKILSSSALFLAVFLVYLHTANPVFQGDDSPETIAACVTLGIQHPPGYPLHTLLGRLAAMLPLGNPGWKVNLSAAFFGALAVLLCFLSIRDVLNRGPKPPKWGAWIAAGSALSLAFSRPFWGQCLSAKGGIYTLQAAFLGVLLWCLVKLSLGARAERWLLLLCLATGLGLSNHWETEVLFLPALMVALFLLRSSFAADRFTNRFLGFLAGSLLFVAGLSVWLYLPLRSSLNPALDWGHPSSFGRFIWVVLRSQYTGMEAGFVGSLKNALTGRGAFSAAWDQWPGVMAQARRVVFNFGTGLGPVLWIFSLVGLWDLGRKGLKALLAFNLSLLATFVLIIIFYFSLDKDSLWILDVFMIPVYFSQAFLVGLGLAACVEKVPGPAASGLIAAAMASCLPAVLLIYFDIDKVNQSSNFGAYDNGRNVLDSVKRGGVLLAEGDEMIFSTCYFQEVDGRRRDIATLPSSHLSFPWGIEMLGARYPWLSLPTDLTSYPSMESLYKGVIGPLVLKQAAIRPFYTGLSHGMLHHFFKEWEPNWVSAGASLEYVPSHSPSKPPREQVSALRQRLFLLPTEGIGIWEAFDRSDLARAYLMSGVALAGMEGSSASRPPDWYLAQAVHLVPDADRAEFWNVWGLAMTRLQKFESARSGFLESVALKPGVKVLVSLSNVQVRLGRYAEAVTTAQRALALDPGSKLAAYSLEQALYAIDKYGRSH